MGRDEIEAAMRQFIGEPLSDMWRYAGFQSFAFGVPHLRRNRKGEEVAKPEYGLVAACSWRIEAHDGSAISSEDYRPVDRGADAAVLSFLDDLLAEPPIVLSLAATTEQGLHVVLSRGFVLTITPDDSPDQHVPDQWWLLWGSSPRQMFVVESPQAHE